MQRVTLTTPSARITDLPAAAFESLPGSLLHGVFSQPGSSAVLNIPLDWLDAAGLEMLVQAYRDGKIRMPPVIHLSSVAKLVKHFRLPSSVWPRALVWQTRGHARVAEAAKPVVEAALFKLGILQPGTPSFSGFVIAAKGLVEVVDMGTPVQRYEVDVHLDPLAEAVQVGLREEGYMAHVREWDGTLLIKAQLPAVS